MCRAAEDQAARSAPGRTRRARAASPAWPAATRTAVPRRRRRDPRRWEQPPRLAARGTGHSSPTIYPRQSPPPAGAIPPPQPGIATAPGCRSADQPTTQHSPGAAPANGTVATPSAGAHHVSGQPQHAVGVGAPGWTIGRRAPSRRTPARLGVAGGGPSRGSALVVRPNQARAARIRIDSSLGPTSAISSPSVRRSLWMTGEGFAAAVADPACARPARLSGGSDRCAGTAASGCTWSSHAAGALLGELTSASARRSMARCSFGHSRNASPERRSRSGVAT
jgi:hypothetical protein